MKLLKLSIALATAFAFGACSGPQTDHSKMDHNAPANSNAAPAGPQTLTEVPRPKKIEDMMVQRGDQDKALPILKIVEPKAGATIASSTVAVKLELDGDLKGYQPMMDPETKMGNHIHVILDNQPYEAYYNIDGEAFELRNVADGEHTLRVFPSRPWHESYKNDGAFQMVKFTVKNGGADTSKPATTNSGNTVANANSTAPKATPEGKDMQPSTAGAVDPEKPLLTFSRPKGEYKDANADAIMIDFWLKNARLKDGGGDYRVRYQIDGGGEWRYIDAWAPIWLSGWSAGKHKIKLELVSKSDTPVENGGYNSTEREFTVVK